MLIKKSRAILAVLAVLAILGATAFFLPATANTPAPAAAREKAPVPVEAKTENAVEDKTSLLAGPAALAIDVEAAMKDRVIGSETAPVTIIEYASLTCGHCAHFETKILPEVKKRLLDTGKARLIFRDFPLDNFSLKGAMMARCAPADKYFNLLDVIFTNQDRWTRAKDPLASLQQLGALAGMDQDTFNACTSNKALETAILENVQKAQAKYQLKATPSFVFNDGAESFAGAQSADQFETIVNKLTKK